MNVKNLRLNSVLNNESVSSKYPLINSCYEDGFRVGSYKYSGPIMISKSTVINWKISNRKISFLDFDVLTNKNYNAEFILLGVGKTFDTPYYELKSNFIKKKINLEIMSTFSACRVWNLTIQDDRNVIGFFIPLNFF